MHINEDGRTLFWLTCMIFLNSAKMLCEIGRWNAPRTHHKHFRAKED